MQAVHHLRGPCLVIAGAGSGKTRVITHKLQALVQSGMAPRNVAAITFTNKAAAEMRERARQLVGKAAGEFVISTFHALGVRLLRQDGEAVGLKPNFSILDSDDQLALMKDVSATTDNALARRFQWAVSGWKNADLSPEQAEAEARQANNADLLQAARIYARYNAQLAAYQSCDFDDLILLPLKLLRSHDDVRAKWQQQLRYLLVDEYQDTNATQYELLKLLVGAHADFTAVGDDDQSIYGWRGADIENLKKLPRDYPNLTVIKLEQNYRSTTRILQAANHVIGGNPKAFDKTLWSALGEGAPVEVMRCDSEDHEAERIATRIVTQRAAQGGDWKPYAVLYRANHQSRALETALRKAQVPYVVSGGQSFFDRAEIKDLCAYLRLLANADDDPAFIRAVTTPKRGIGATTLERLGQAAGQWRCSLFEALFNDAIGVSLGARPAEQLREFGRYINALEYRARTEPAGELLRELLQHIGYERHLHDTADNDKQAADKWQNVLDFVEWLSKKAAEDQATLTQLAQTIALITQLQDRSAERDAVTLSTVHAAKGLEWPHVFIAGCEEGLLPFNRDDAPIDPLRLQEERRLMYVAITRAQRTLVVTYAARRKKGRELRATTPSRFIAEMQLEQAAAPGTGKAAVTDRLARLRATLASSAPAPSAVD
ncbi:MAG: UvrD-helicase domain-containing protein [Betaproteobacteria bacterium]|nr:UvrD-helicase domain-containing protein [Betaproteobacteria bacterium]